MGEGVGVGCCQHFGGKYCPSLQGKDKTFVIIVFGTKKARLMLGVSASK